MKIYYDKEDFKLCLSTLNPINNYKSGSYGFDSIIMKLFFGIMIGVFGTIIVWITFPILLLTPFKIKKNVEVRK